MSATAQAGPDLPTQTEVARIVAGLSPARLEAWLACGERIAGGMPVTQAERLMWAEIAAAARRSRWITRECSR